MPDRFESWLWFPLGVRHPDIGYSHWKWKDGLVALTPVEDFGDSGLTSCSITDSHGGWGVAEEKAMPYLTNRLKQGLATHNPWSHSSRHTELGFWWHFGSREIHPHAGRAAGTSNQHHLIILCFCFSKAKQFFLVSKKNVAPEGWPTSEQDG